MCMYNMYQDILLYVYSFMYVPIFASTIQCVYLDMYARVNELREDMKDYGVLVGKGGFYTNGSPCYVQ